MFEIPGTIWGPAVTVLPQIPKQLLFSPTFPKLWQTIRQIRQMYANCLPLFATFAIWSPNSSRVVTNSPIDRHAGQLVANILTNHLKTISLSSPNDR